MIVAYNSAENKIAALQSIAPLTGTAGNSSLAWTIYTGDLVSHDPQTQLSRAYTEYAETSVYELFKQYITGPVFPVLGNHDSNPEAIDGMSPTDTYASHALIHPSCRSS